MSVWLTPAPDTILVQEPAGRRRGPRLGAGAQEKYRQRARTS